MKEILDELGMTIGQVRKVLLAKKQTKPRILQRYVTNDMFRIGVVSDTHLCSKHEKLNELHTFYDICRKMKVEAILHAGDLLAGWRIYKGQENEVHTFGAMGQANYAIEHYPKIPETTTYFIGGNHDESWYKLGGVDTNILIADKRQDMEYLGWYNANVIIGGIRIQLHHGDGGGAYAHSYKGQKFAEAIPSGKKPRVLILGHYHTSFYFWYRNMHILNAGCFEGQSLYLVRKMLNPAVGGWIIEIRTSKRPNDVLACKPAWIPFF